MDRSVHTMDLVVQTTGIAHNTAAILDPAPESGLAGATVAAVGVCSLLQVAVLGVAALDQRSVGSIHLMIETAGVTQIVASGISSPERSVGDSAVDTLFGDDWGRRGG